MISPKAASAKSVAEKGLALAERIKDPSDTIAFDLISTVTPHQGRMELHLSEHRLAQALGAPAQDLSPDLAQITTDFARKRRGIETRLISGEAEPTPDATLIRLLAKARRWCDDLRKGMTLTDIATREGHSDSCIRSRAPLAFLSPKIQSAILAGTQPADLSLERIIRSGIPLDWAEQDTSFGFN